MDEKYLENLFLTLPPVWRMESRVPLPLGTSLFNQFILLTF